jgi:phosphatidylglycerophosphate synthase
MLYSQKAKFQHLAEKLAFAGMTANQATLLGILFVLLTMLAFYLGLSTDASFWLLLVPLFILFRLIMNALDGLLARAQNKASAAGEIMNELSDVLGDTCSYGILYFVLPSARTAIFIFILCIWFCEFVAILGNGLPGGRRRQESAGGGKPERAVGMSVLALGIYLFPALRDHSTNVFFIFSFLVFLTALLRIQRSLKDARGKPYESRTQFGR